MFQRVRKPRFAYSVSHNLQEGQMPSLEDVQEAKRLVADSTAGRELEPEDFDPPSVTVGNETR